MESGAYEYEHTLFPPGTRVWIDPSIRDIHPLSPIAGREGIVTKGIAYENLRPFEDQEAKVPVMVNGEGHLVECAYVLKKERGSSC